MTQRLISWREFASCDLESKPDGFGLRLLTGWSLRKLADRDRCSPLIEREKVIFQLLRRNKINRIQRKYIKLGCSIAEDIDDILVAGLPIGFKRKFKRFERLEAQLIKMGYRVFPIEAFLVLFTEDSRRVNWGRIDWNKNFRHKDEPIIRFTRIYRDIYGISNEENPILQDLKRALSNPGIPFKFEYYPVYTWGRLKEEYPEAAKYFQENHSLFEAWQAQ